MQAAACSQALLAHTTSSPGLSLGTPRPQQAVAPGRSDYHYLNIIHLSVAATPSAPLHKLQQGEVQAAGADCRDGDVGMVDITVGSTAPRRSVQRNVGRLGPYGNTVEL